MKDLVLPRHLALLARLLHGDRRPPLLAFDFDGVLAPVIPDPRGGSMSRRTRALVRQLAARFPVAVISGRSYPKLQRAVGAAVPVLVGNHGAEHRRRTAIRPAERARVRRWEAQLRSALRGLPAVFLEHKGSTLAVHYGESPDPRAGRAVDRAVRALRGARLVPGKNLVNVLPSAFPTKGDAVRRLLRELRCRHALFVGDDVTDEDVFALPRTLVFGVHVGPGPSRAAWRLASREDVDVLLEGLLELSEPRRLVRREEAPPRARARGVRTAGGIR